MTQSKTIMCVLSGMTGKEMMIHRFTIPFVGVVAVFGLAQPTFGDHNCARFANFDACASAPIGTFTQQQVEALGGTFVELQECHQFLGSCDQTKGMGNPAICSDNLPKQTCIDLLGPLAPIPTVSAWGMAVMSLLAVTAGTVVLMRRRSMVST